MTDQIDQLHAVLEAEYTRRSAARTRLEQAKQALERGQRIAHDALDDLAHVRQTLTDATAAHAAKLQADIVAGAEHSPPAIVLDDRAQRAAEHRAAVAGKAVEALQSQHAQAQGELQAAEAAVVAVVDKILQAEKMALAEKVSVAMGEVRRLVELLRIYVPDPFRTRISEQRELEPEVRAALDSVPKRDDLHTPTNILRGDLGPRVQRAGRAPC